MFKLIFSYIFLIIFLSFIVITSFLMRGGYSYITSKKSSLEIIKDRDDNNSSLVFTKNYISGVYSIFKEYFYKETQLIYYNTYAYKIKNIKGCRILNCNTLLENENISLNSLDTLIISHSELEKLSKYLLSLSWIEDVVFEKTFFPHTVSISITEAKPWLVVDNGIDKWLVSKKGTILSSILNIDNPNLILETSILPRLFLEDNMDNSITNINSISDKINYVLKNLEYIDLAGGFPFEFNIINVLPMGGISLEPLDEKMGRKVFFKISSLDEARSILERYTKVINDIKSRDEIVKEIDLRFANQVIVR